MSNRKLGKDPGPVSPARLARDILLLYLTAFLRALSTGLIGVLFGFYLAKLRFDAAQIGYVIAAGMKIAYDLLLYAAFRKAKPPEETATAGKI